MKMPLPIAILNVFLVTLIAAWIYKNITLLPIEQSLLEAQILSLYAWFIFDVDKKSLTWNRFGWIIRNKVGMWIIVLLSTELDSLMFKDDAFIAYTVCLFFFAVEALGIISLVQEIDISIPTFLVDYLNKLKSDNDDKNNPKK